MSDTQCAFCRFAEVEPQAEAAECRRYPPMNEQDSEGLLIAFPLVKLDMWCGEFSRKVN